MKCSHLCGMLLVVSMSGCVVREVVRPQSKQTMIVAQSEKGAVISWKARGDTLYSILYRPGVSSKASSGTSWQPLTGAQKLRFVDGENVTWTDNEGRSRIYFLLEEPARSKETVKNRGS